MRKLMTSLLMMALHAATHAAPIVVQPGSAAGYMYFPAQINVQASGGGSSGSVTVNVNASPSVPPSVMTVGDAGTCATASSTGQLCTWGDGRQFRYAGINAGRKIFAEAVSADPTLIWGCYNNVTGAISNDDGLANTNAVLAVNHAYSPCKSGTTEYPAVAHLFCQQKNMYLPAINELQLLYNNRAALGGFSINGYYWSSTELDSNFAWLLNFVSGFWEYGVKYSTHSVRCVRSF